MQRRGVFDDESLLFDILICVGQGGLAQKIFSPAGRARCFLRNFQPELTGDTGRSGREGPVVDTERAGEEVFTRSATSPNASQGGALWRERHFHSDCANAREACEPTKTSKCALYWGGQDGGSRAAVRRFIPLIY
jgi:hypothetical protein